MSGMYPTDKIQSDGIRKRENAAISNHLISMRIIVRDNERCTRGRQMDVFKCEIEGLQKELALRSAMIELFFDADKKARQAAIEKGEDMKLKILGELSAIKDALMSLQGGSGEGEKVVVLSVKEKEELQRSIEKSEEEKVTLLQGQEQSQRAMSDMAQSRDEREDLGLFATDSESYGY